MEEWRCRGVENLGSTSISIWITATLTVLFLQGARPRGISAQKWNVRGYKARRRMAAEKHEAIEAMSPEAVAQAMGTSGRGGGLGDGVIVGEDGFGRTESLESVATEVVMEEEEEEKARAGAIAAPKVSRLSFTDFFECLRRVAVTIKSKYDRFSPPSPINSRRFFSLHLKHAGPCRRCIRDRCNESTQAYAPSSLSLVGSSMPPHYLITSHPPDQVIRAYLCLLPEPLNPKLLACV